LVTFLSIRGGIRADGEIATEQQSTTTLRKGRSMRQQTKQERKESRLQRIISAAVTFVRKMNPTPERGLFSKDQSLKCQPFLLPLVVLATLCLNASLRADEQVPFEGTFNPIVLSTTSLDPTHVRFDFDVHVQATLLGKARGPAFAILDLTSFTYVGEATWAAANGDKVFITFDGTFVPTDTPGLFDNVETIEVVGGTGRFEGATGEGTALGQFDAIAVAAPAPAPFEGTISSPGSLQK
jgi:hypothetical protein